MDVKYNLMILNYKSIKNAEFLPINVGLKLLSDACELGKDELHNEEIHV